MLFCPRKLLTCCFIEKSYFFVALKETLWFCHHLDEDQCQVNVQISVSVVCHLDSHEQTNLTCFWALTNLQSAVLQKIMFCAVASAVTVHFLHCSCWTQHLFGVCFHLVSVIKFFSFIQVKNVMCWFGPKMNDMLVHWKKNMFCVTVLAVTVHCWHHLDRQQSAASLCSLVLTEHCFFMKNNQRWCVALPQKDLDMLFHWKIMFCVLVFAMKVWRWHHFDQSQHKGDVCFHLEQLAIFLGSNETFSVTCCFALTNFQHTISLKNLVFVWWLWQRHCSFDITLTEISAKLMFLNLCLCCLSVGFTSKNEFDTFLSTHKSSACCLDKKNHLLCGGFSSDSVFLHCSCWIQHLFSVCFHLALVVNFCCSCEQTNVMCCFALRHF